MTIDKWLEIKSLINDKFTVEDSGTYFSEEHGGTKAEFLVFESQLGRVKLEFVTKPKVIDKKVNYSNRIGSDVIIDYQYSESEKNCQLFVYRWIDDAEEWQPLASETFNF